MRCAGSTRLSTFFKNSHEGDGMNRHYIVEQKPGAWRAAIIQAVIYAAIFMAMGYLARPVIERWL